MNTGLKQPNQSSLYSIDARVPTIIVVGDLHGHLETFAAAVDYWKSRRELPIVFLGDYADRGPSGVEILEALIPLSREKNVIALTGNHELYSPAGDPLFQPCTLISEVQQKRGDWAAYYHRVLQPFFSRLYLAALLPGKLLFVHGGVSSRVQSIEDLKRPSAQVEEDILWSDPADIAGERPDPRGSGVEFGPDVSRAVIGRLGVRHVVRGHQPDLAKEGLFYSHNRNVITISGTDYYGGRPFFLEIENLEGGLDFDVHFV